MAATIAVFAQDREPTDNADSCGSELAREEAVSVNIVAE
jgi:hypothetical protein